MKCQGFVKTRSTSYQNVRHLVSGGRVESFIPKIYPLPCKPGIPLYHAMPPTEGASLFLQPCDEGYDKLYSHTAAFCLPSFPAGTMTGKQSSITNSLSSLTVGRGSLQGKKGRFECWNIIQLLVYHWKRLEKSIKIMLEEKKVNKMSTLDSLKHHANSCLTVFTSMWFKQC